MNNDTNIDFALEMIKKYGEDRFYHNLRRTESDEYGNIRTVIIYAILNQDTDKESCNNFFRSIQLKDCIWQWDFDRITITESTLFGLKVDLRLEMCRTAYGFSKRFKEFGLRTCELPDHIHARMILGEKNEWVIKYLKFIEEYKK